MIVYVLYLDCSKRVVRDVVFVIDTTYESGSIISWFENIREFMERIIINLKANSPKTLFGLITFDYSARLEFNISNHTDLSTLLTAIKLEIPDYSYYLDTTNVTSALRLLLSGSVEDGFLNLREKTSKVAIVITDGYSSSSSLLQSAANSLHSANVFDVYAIIVSRYFYSSRRLQQTASDPSFVFSTNYLDAQPLAEDVIEVLCSRKQFQFSMHSYICT